MARDVLIEAIYVSPSVLEKEPENPYDEALYKLNDISEVDFTLNDLQFWMIKKANALLFCNTICLSLGEGLSHLSILK